MVSPSFFLVNYVWSCHTGAGWYVFTHAAPPFSSTINFPWIQNIFEKILSKNFTFRLSLTISNYGIKLKSNYIYFKLFIKVIVLWHLAWTIICSKKMVLLLMDKFWSCVYILQTVEPATGITVHLKNQWNPRLWYTTWVFFPPPSHSFFFFFFSKV